MEANLVAENEKLKDYEKDNKKRTAYDLLGLKDMSGAFESKHVKDFSRLKSGF